MRIWRGRTKNRSGDYTIDLKEKTTEIEPEESTSTIQKTSIVAKRLLEILQGSPNLSTNDQPRHWEDFDQERFAQWLEEQILCGKSHKAIATQIGIPKTHVKNVIDQFINRERFKRLIEDKKSMLRTIVLASAPVFIRRLKQALLDAGTNETCPNCKHVMQLKQPELVDRITNTLLKIIDMREPDISSLVQINLAPTQEKAERYEGVFKVLDGLIGPTTESGEGPGEDSRELGGEPPASE